MRSFYFAEELEMYATLKDLPPIMAKLKAFRERYYEEEIKKMLGDIASDCSNEIDFEGFLRVSLSMLSLILIWIYQAKI